jgi:hypothetical protein
MADYYAFIVSSRYHHHVGEGQMIKVCRQTGRPEGTNDPNKRGTSDSDDSTYLLTSDLHPSSSDNSIVGLSSGSSMSESNPDSEDSFTDDSSHLAYSSNDNSSTQLG